MSEKPGYNLSDKIIYFVRHGESEGNVDPRYQFPHAELTEKGRAQTEEIGKRCISLGADIIISSTMKRAHDTAKTIARHTGFSIVESALFREADRPSFVRGKLPTDPAVVEIRAALEENADDISWHYSDEENPHDRHVRAVKALDFLLKRPEKTLIVATHGTILRHMLIVMVLGVEYPGFDIIKKFQKAFVTSNTGLTECHHVDGRWRVKVWNDDAHLG
jgi:2,3-bisphosphoglycerate-dependent phosphoglycerate mutase